MIADREQYIADSRWLRKADSGQAMVEFVLSILLLMFLIFGIIEFIMFIATYNALANAAKTGVRYAIVHGTGNANCSGPGAPGLTCPDAGAANVTSAVTAYASISLHNTSAMTITPTYPNGSSAAPARVRVVVSYPYQPFFGLGWPTVTVRAAAEGRIVN